ncbi:MAG: hypothetical protein GY696_09555, partial [Gammaproteobacteria bacterium]|nr:hypothetical protein [Gammaproteobacteria bacterium]
GGSLKYVLLVGGGSYDHKDILQTGAVTYIPPHYEATAAYSLYTNTDAPYVRDDSGKLFAAIGRWPVRTSADLGALVDKNLAWSAGAGGSAVLLAEQTDSIEQINFATALDTLSSNLASDWTLNKIYIDTIVANNPGMTLAQAAAKAREELISSFESNDTRLVMFNGHASAGQLSKQNLLTASDASSLTGSSMWLPLSCYVTYYESTHVNTLAHQLLFAGNAVTISGAMSYSDQSLNTSMASGILSGLADGDSIGGATLSTHQGRGNDQLMQINWATLGDPSLRAVAPAQQ